MLQGTGVTNAVTVGFGVGDGKAGKVAVGWPASCCLRGDAGVRVGTRASLVGKSAAVLHAAETSKTMNVRLTGNGRDG
jgi:hypothetical protein